MKVQKQKERASKEIASMVEREKVVKRDRERKRQEREKKWGGTQVLFFFNPAIRGRRAAIQDMLSGGDIILSHACPREGGKLQRTSHLISFRLSLTHVASRTRGSKNRSAAACCPFDAGQHQQQQWDRSTIKGIAGLPLAHRSHILRLITIHVGPATFATGIPNNGHLFHWATLSRATLTAGFVSLQSRIFDRTIYIPWLPAVYNQTKQMSRMPIGTWEKLFKKAQSRFLPTYQHSRLHTCRRRKMWPVKRRHWCNQDKSWLPLSKNLAR